LHCRRTRLIREGGKYAANEREIGRTSGLPGLITYNKTTVDLVWETVKFRKYCIGDPTGMIVDALEKDRAPAKKWFTLKVILPREYEQ
jgi:hypothetical protein